MITIPRLSQSLPFDDENTLLVIIWSCTKSIISLIYWTSLYIPSCRWCNYISAKVDGKRGRKLILYKQFKSPLKPLMKFTYIYYAQVTWLHLMIFFCIQKAEGTSVSGVLSDSRNRPLLFIRLSAIYLFLTAPTPFLLYISSVLLLALKVFHRYFLFAEQIWSFVRWFAVCIDRWTKQMQRWVCDNAGWGSRFAKHTAGTRAGGSH